MEEVTRDKNNIYWPAFDDFTDHSAERRKGIYIGKYVHPLFHFRRILFVTQLIRYLVIKGLGCVLIRKMKRLIIVQ